MFWAVGSLLLAGVGVGGSLFLSLGMGLKACPLCFYQRAFVMAAFAVLTVGLLADRRRPGLLCLLALPSAFAGLGIAGFHEFLVVTGKMECPMGVFDLGSAPSQSLTLFIMLALTTMMGLAAGKSDYGGSPVLAGWVGVILGIAFAWGCIRGVAPMTATPPPPPGEPLTTCRLVS